MYTVMTDKEFEEWLALIFKIINLEEDLIVCKEDVSDLEIIAARRLEGILQLCRTGK